MLVVTDRFTLDMLPEPRLTEPGRLTMLRIEPLQLAAVLELITAMEYIQRPVVYAVSNPDNAAIFAKTLQRKVAVRKTPIKIDKDVIVGIPTESIKWLLIEIL